MHTTNLSRIELRHLRYFLALSEELHFRKAAERLKMAQPPLSQAIRKLERELGVALFDRTTRVVTLTTAGRVLAVEARQVLAAFETAVDATRQAGGMGGLRIGFAPHLPIEQLLRFLGELHVHDPGLRVEVTHAPAVDQIRRLERGELDVGLFPWAGAADEGLRMETVFSGEPLAAFLPADHPLAPRRTVGPAELADETLVSFPHDVNPALAESLRRSMERNGYRFRELREAEGEHARDWIVGVAAGSGVALLPHRFKEFADAGALLIRRPLDPPLAMPDTVLAWRSDAPSAGEPPLASARAVARALRAD